MKELTPGTIIASIVGLFALYKIITDYNSLSNAQKHESSSAYGLGSYFSAGANRFMLILWVCVFIPCLIHVIHHLS
jgi:hypothetical protein